MLYILLSMCAVHLSYSQQLARDGACDLTSNFDTILHLTQIPYENRFSASAVSPRIPYSEQLSNDSSFGFVYNAKLFNDEVLSYLVQEPLIIGPCSVAVVRFRPSAVSDWSLVDFVISNENNITTHDDIVEAMRNVAIETDFIDLNSLNINLDVIYCLAQEIVTHVGTITWPVALQGTTVTTDESCSVESLNGADFKLAVRECIDGDGGAVWGSWECTDCGGPSAGYQLQELYQSLPDGSSVEQLIMRVADLTEMTGSVRVIGIEATVNIVEYILQETPLASISRQVVEDLIHIVHNIQIIYSGTVVDAQAQSTTSSRLLKALQNIITTMQLSPTYQFQSVHDSIAVFVDELDTSHESGTWFQFGSTEIESNSDKLILSRLTTVPNVAKPRSTGDTTVYVQNTGSTARNVTRRSFVLHQRDVLFRTPENELRLSAEKNNDFLREINTRIITALETGGDIGDPIVKGYFKPIKIDNKTLNEKCQSWDWSKNAGRGGWTEEGCTHTLDGERVVCVCDSFTSYSVAMDVYPVPIAVPPQYVISRIGAAIAAILLLATVFIFVCLKDLRHSKPHQILSNLFLALALWHMFFAIGIDLTDYREACVSFGIIMHYVLLVALCWMVVGAIDIHIVFVKARALPIKQFILKASALAWGIPMVIVAVVAVADLNLYREEDKFCFIIINPAWAFISVIISPIFATVAIITIVHYMAYTMSVRKLDGKVEDEADPMFLKRHHARVLVTASSIIIALGILTTVIGFVAIYDVSVGTEVVFLLFSLLEGVVIFGICCVWPSQVRRMLLNKLGLIKTIPSKHGIFKPYWSLSKWKSTSVLPEAEPHFFLDNTHTNGVLTPQNIVLESFPMSDISSRKSEYNSTITMESTA